MNKPLTIGLIINPIAGMGGAVGLKGTDNVLEEAIKRGAKPIANRLAAHVFENIADTSALKIITGTSELGESLCQTLALEHIALPILQDGIEGGLQGGSDSDSTVLAKQLMNYDLDLLVFVGGDGTARDVLKAAPEKLPVLGVPSGVKMYSGVFARNASAATEVINQIIAGKAVSYREVDVRDLDEQAMRDNKVITRFYGKLWTILDQQLVQQMKGCSVVSDELIKEEIAAYIVEIAEDDLLYIIGSGTTTQAIKQQLTGEAGSLLGFDVILNGDYIAKDVWETPMLELIEQYQAAKVILTPTGGQGFLLGRGNQQLSSKVIEKVGVDNLIIVATQEKLDALAGQPLWVDTRNQDLDKQLAGIKPVLVDYDEYVLYSISSGED